MDEKTRERELLAQARRDVQPSDIRYENAGYQGGTGAEGTGLIAFRPAIRYANREIAQVLFAFFGDSEMGAAFRGENCARSRGKNERTKRVSGRARRSQA
ncbi:MAG TPA: hypothetical protein VK669_11705 [Candidatus Limnocylindrales bacterium]|nr:hypothetical protein [Candidatus Limnocylindrales bacterium]